MHVRLFLLEMNGLYGLERVIKRTGLRRPSTLSQLRYVSYDKSINVLELRTDRTNSFVDEISVCF